MPIMEFTSSVVQYLVLIFVFLIGLAVLGIIILAVLDMTQTGDAIRRNYPVIGRFRHLFSTLGEFFRQYFFCNGPRRAAV